MEYINISEKNRDMVNEFLIREWYSTNVVVRGRANDLSTADGFIAMEQDELKGLVTYLLYDDVCEIMSLNSLEERRGIGTKLIHQVVEVAKQRHCSKVVLITTNDNLNAIGFYQKRGFDLARIYHNAMEESRKLKPEIPLFGEHGIPLKHELEFEMQLLESDSQMKE